MSQSLPNQVNDFNVLPDRFWRHRASGCRNPFQTRSTTSIRKTPGTLSHVCERVAIPSKPGQRLQFRVGGASTEVSSRSVAIPSKPGQRLQYMVLAQWDARRETSQSLPNQVNDFNSSSELTRGTSSSGVAIPSKPGQRLQSVGINPPQFSKGRVAIPSKPGQRLQSRAHKARGGGNQRVAIPSKPGQRLQCWHCPVVNLTRLTCRNPFQTRSTTSILKGAYHAAPDLMECRNPFQTRSTTSMLTHSRWVKTGYPCRNPFQTRSTTSIRLETAKRSTIFECRNPFQTRSTTSIRL